LLDESVDALAEALQHRATFSHACLLLLDESCNSIALRVLLDETGLTQLETNLPSFVGNDACLVALLADPTLATLTVEAETLASLVLNPQALVPSHAVVLPLLAHGQVMGCLALQRPAPFAIDELTWLATVAPVVALAMTNHRLQLKHQTQHGREFLINRLTMAIRQSLDINQILATAAEELSQVMGVSRCIIQSYPSTLALEALLASQDVATEGVQSFTYQLSGVASLQAGYLPASGVAPFERAVFKLRAPTLGQPHTLNPFVLDDTRDCPALLLKETSTTFLVDNQIKSLAVFPILLGADLVGSITLHQCDTYRSWLTQDLDLFRTLAEHLGVALAQARLFDEVAQKNEQLNATLAQLQQAQTQLIQSEKMAVLGQFVAGIAHEVNTPLGSILGNNNTLLSCMERLANELTATPWPTETPPLPPSLEPKRVELMTHLLKLNRLACHRIDETVKNLRNFARLDESERKVANLHDGLNSTLLLMRSSLPKHLTLVKAFAPELPSLSCYPGLLNQVFMNLIVNALHAMAEVEQPQLTLTTAYHAATANQTGTLSISIADNGKGISPEHLSKIFDPGFTTKGRGVGTGLGLALCYRIIEKHGGTIAVSSVVGEGTTFILTLPLVHSA
jgi:signal transduction histidine kinase